MQIRSREDVNKENSYFKKQAEKYLPLMLSGSPEEVSVQVSWRENTGLKNILTKPTELLKRQSAIVSMQEITVDLELEGSNARGLAKYLNNALHETQTAKRLRGEKIGKGLPEDSPAPASRSFLVMEEKNYGFSAQKASGDRYQLILRLPDDVRLPTTDIKAFVQEVIHEIHRPPERGAKIEQG